MIYLLILVLILTTDLSIKYWIEKRKSGETEEILHGKILLKKSHNEGAMLNLLEKRPQIVHGCSLGMLFGMVGIFGYLLGRKGMRLLKLGMAFLIGGAGSNVCDRLCRKYVVDYFSFNVKWERVRKIVFNLGDFFIFLGSFLVILWNSRYKS